MRWAAGGRPSEQYCCGVANVLSPFTRTSGSFVAIVHGFLDKRDNVAACEQPRRPQSIDFYRRFWHLIYRRFRRCVVFFGAGFSFDSLLSVAVAGLTRLWSFRPYTRGRPLSSAVCGPQALHGCAPARGDGKLGGVRVASPAPPLHHWLPRPPPPSTFLNHRRPAYLIVFMFLVRRS